MLRIALLGAAGMMTYAVLSTLDGAAAADAPRPDDRRGAGGLVAATVTGASDTVRAVTGAILTPRVATPSRVPQPAARAPEPAPRPADAGRSDAARDRDSAPSGVDSPAAGGESTGESTPRPASKARPPVRTPAGAAVGAVVERTTTVVDRVVASANGVVTDATRAAGARRPTGATPLPAGTGGASGDAPELAAPDAVGNPPDVGAVPGVVGTVPEVIEIVPGVIEIVSEAVRTVPVLVGTVPAVVGSVAEIGALVPAVVSGVLETVPDLVGLVPGVVDLVPGAGSLPLPDLVKPVPDVIGDPSGDVEPTHPGGLLAPADVPTTIAAAVPVPSGTDSMPTAVTSADGFRSAADPDHRSSAATSRQRPAGDSTPDGQPPMGGAPAGGQQAGGHGGAAGQHSTGAVAVALPAPYQFLFVATPNAAARTDRSPGVPALPG